MMQKKWFYTSCGLVIGVAAMVALLIVGLARGGAVEAQVDPSTPSPVLAARPRAYYRMPAREMIEWRLRKAGRISADSSEEEIALALEEWYFKFAKASPSWARPEDRERALANEQAWLEGGARLQAQAAIPITAAVLAIPVEFDAVETLTFQRPTSGYTDCITVTETFTGPMHGNIPYPGVDAAQTVDNNTAYYPSTEAADYEKLIFSRTGITEPLRAGDPNVKGGAGVDISGLTVQTYYDEQSEDTVAVTGMAAPWVPVTHTEAFYGIDVCSPGSQPPATADGQLGRPADLVVEAAEGLKAEGAPYDTYAFWKQFDNNDDGWIDTLWIIHAGRGQEAGGGAEGEDSIWSHSSNLQSYASYENGYVIHDNGTVTTTDDLKIGPFTFQPEDSDLGVLSEEFGHNFFGFPDLYTTDSANSVAFWSHMAAGSWGGWLGGVKPVGFPLWFKMVADCNGTPCGWAAPMVALSHTTPMTEIKIGQLAQTPAGLPKGIRIDLPDQVEIVANTAGTGKGAYSTSGDEMDNTLDHIIDLTGASAPIRLFVDANWDIEEDWDYGYVQVSTDTVNYVFLDDLDGVLRETNPYGNNLGHGLTGSGSDRLRFDLSAYTGRSITLRFRYRTDVAVSNPGWWIDNVVVRDAAGEIFSEDFEGGLGGWTNDGWREVPYTAVYQRYYLVEWRNGVGFDASLNDPGAYQSVYYDQDEWWVDRAPYEIPGAVVWLRNTKYDFSYSLNPQLLDPPSYGPKYGLLVVDSHYRPYVRTDGNTVWGRVASNDSSLTLRDLTGMFTLRSTDLVTKGVLFTDTFGERPGVDGFYDRLGYYPGISGTTFIDWDASVVIPTRNDTDYWPRWIPWGDLGNPGLYGYGVNIQVVEEAQDGSWGKIRVWYDNDTILVRKHASADRVFDGETVTFTLLLKDASGSRYADSHHYVYPATLSDPITGGLTYAGGLNLMGSGTVTIVDNVVRWRGNLGGHPLHNPDAIIEYAATVELGQVGLVTNTSYLVVTQQPITVDTYLNPITPTILWPKHASYVFHKTIMVGGNVYLPTVLKNGP